MSKQPVIPPHNRIGLSRTEASELIGISPSTFDELVRDGRMPKPKRINSRKVWARPALEKFFGELPEEGQGLEKPSPCTDLSVD